jgi:hypothetical protein
MDTSLAWIPSHPNVCYHRRIVWRSRLGHIYLLRLSPIIEPLPDPIPRDKPAPPLVVPPDEDWDSSRIWDDTPPEADTKPPPEPDPDNDAAPF